MKHHNGDTIVEIDGVEDEQLAVFVEAVEENLSSAGMIEVINPTGELDFEAKKT